MRSGCAAGGDPPRSAMVSEMNDKPCPIVMPLRALAGLVLSCLLLLLAGSVAAFEPGIMVAVRQSGEALIVDATIDADVSLRVVWEVLTDFDHMAAILTNLTSSRVVRRSGNVLIVRQEGVATYGPLSLPFESEREIRLEPMKRVLVKQISGTVKRMESEASLTQTARGVQVTYHAEVVPDSALARTFGAPFVRHEVEEQFQAMAAEMTRRWRSAAPPTALLPDLRQPGAASSPCGRPNLACALRLPDSRPNSGS